MQGSTPALVDLGLARHRNVMKDETEAHNHRAGSTMESSFVTTVYISKLLDCSCVPVSSLMVDWAIFSCKLSVANRASPY